jgi:hypothetical protein
MAEPVDEIVPAENVAHQHGFAQSGREKFVATGLPRLAVLIEAEPVESLLLDEQQQIPVAVQRPMMR